jgi:hypothetical protein
VPDSRAGTVLLKRCPFCGVASFRVARFLFARSGAALGWRWRLTVLGGQRWIVMNKGSAPYGTTTVAAVHLSEQSGHNCHVKRSKLSASALYNIMQSVKILDIH